MKRHKRDTGGFGRYIPHPTQGAKAEFSELSTLPPPMPTPAHLSPAAKAQSPGLWRQSEAPRTRLGALGSFPLVAGALSWGRLAPAREQPQLFDTQGLETWLYKVL